MYIAKKVMTVNGERRFPGDPVPEAATWLRVESYLRAGWIEEAEEAPRQAKKKPEPKPEPVDEAPKPVAKKAPAKTEPKA